MSVSHVLKSLGKKIKFLRRSRNLTHKDVAYAIGHKTPNAIICIETGKIFPTIDRLEKIAEVLGLTLIELLSMEIKDEDIERQPSTIIGKKIFYIRTKRLLSLSDLAVKSGVKEEIVNRFERGKSRGSDYNHILNIAKALDVSLEYLLNDNEKIPEDMT